MAIVTLFAKLDIQRRRVVAHLVFAARGVWLGARYVGFMASMPRASLFLQPSTVMAVFGLFLFRPSRSIQALQIACDDM